MIKGENKALSKGLLVAASCVFVLVSLVVAMGFVPSSAIADHADSSTFGIGSATSSTSAQVGVLYEEVAEKPVETDSLLKVTSESTALARATDYDVMVGVYQIEKQREEERRAAEEAARIAEQRVMEQVQQSIANWQGLVNGDGSAGAVSGLEPVDWTVGKAAFVATWGERIDAYLSRTYMAGYGPVFAEAAWENCVDPRWSPAISNTESGNGFNCFLPHNAWGWGQSSWSSWSEAINAHVAGLAKGYGYSISMTYAGIYCPPNTAHWFNNTLNEMKCI